jgi:hypothetical protein
MSPYQKAAYIESADRWKRDVVHATSPIDKSRAEDAVVAARKLLKINGRPMFQWFESPTDAMAFIATSQAEQLTRKRHISDELTPFFRWMESEHTLSGLIRRLIVDPQAGFYYRWKSTDPIIHHSTTRGIDKKLRQPDEIFKPEMSQFTWEIHKFIFAKERLSLNINDETFERINVAAEIAQSCCLWWNHQDVVVMSARPTAMTFDDADRLHSVSGPALCYGRRFQKYLVHGVEIESDIIKDPFNCLTPIRIEKEHNVEVRRTLLELYGADRYLRKTGAVVIHEGRQNRKLWWRPPIDGRHTNMNAGEADTIFSASDQPLVMVEVVNSTPEPDGQIKHYFLRVPPTMRNADEAVAWTFGLTLAEYEPLQET